LIDGEAVVCDVNGLAIFELIRRRGALASAVHVAFDLLELDGKDLRRHPIENRKALLTFVAALRSCCSRAGVFPMSAFGTKRTFAAVQRNVRFWG
jgi:ATP-dependent DNA ligase